ncbi:ATP-binding protein [Spirosoma soli]|uniref:histidine kinase n=1 Tax=Spirosoma soli TaxID=1770529 RepID=A0ABW5LYV0_9BACT
MKSASTTPSESPIQLRAALNLSGSGIMLFDCLRTSTGQIQDFRLVLANRKAEEIAGKSEPDMLNHTGADLFPNTVATGIWQHARHVVEHDEPYETEVNYRATNQPKERWYALKLQKHGDGFAASFTDITVLKQQTLLVENVLNGSINGVIAYEAIRENKGLDVFGLPGSRKVSDLRIRLANEAAARITNTPLGQMIGNTMSALYPAAHASDIFARYVHTIETGEAQRFESFYTYDGVNTWFDISTSKLADGVLVTFVDITATKRYEQELQKSIDNLQRSNQSLERFAYITSHDLQEPLRKIQSFGEMLRHQSEGTISAQSKDLLERMQSAAGRMNTLICDLLSYSRLSSQKRPFERVNLGQVINDVLTDLETAIQTKQAVLDVTSLPLVTGDAVQLRQVFQNLLSNALKFVKPGSIPRIQVECQRLTGREIVPLPGQAVADPYLDQAFFAIRIVDDGIGFDEKYLDRIFTVFQRLHTRNTYQGTGIGLAIVQKAVENHKGYVGAQSRPGSGATFTVYLPDEPYIDTLVIG